MRWGNASANVRILDCWSGSKGCVLVNRLTESGRHLVLLLEAGTPDRNPWIHIPIVYGKTLLRPELNWRFDTEPQEHLDGRKDYWPRRAHARRLQCNQRYDPDPRTARDFDGWEERGATGWSASGTLPYFIKSEADSRGDSTHHDADGPLAV